MSFLTRTIPTPGHAALPCLFGGRKGSFLSLPRAHQVRDRLREHVPSCRQHSELPSARSLVEHDQKWVVPSPMNSSKDSPLFNTNRFSVLCSVHPSIQQNLLCIGIFLSVPENPQSDWWPDVVLPLLKLLPFPISPPKPTLYPSGLPDSHTTLDPPTPQAIFSNSQESTHTPPSLLPPSQVIWDSVPTLASPNSLSHRGSQRLMLYLFKEAGVRNQADKGTSLPAKTKLYHKPPLYPPAPSLHIQAHALCVLNYDLI